MLRHPERADKPADPAEPEPPPDRLERGEVGLGLLVAPTHETADGRPQTAEG